ncbi:MAG: glycosyltransferase family 4 protein [Deltaproteobacteria bacterium]|nr:glycosyltransferase family 4 protein [Deltaproteobacteria bacterium]
MASKRILILDTGKEWGGGTNSLLELLKRIDRSKYQFTALFYHNYKKGNESDIKTEIEKLGIDFLLLEQKKQPVVSKILKESVRIIFSPGKKLKKYFVFLIDCHFRIKPNAARIAEISRERKIGLLYMNNQPSSNLEGIMAARIANIPCIQHSRIGAELNRVEVDAVNNWLTKMICVSQGVQEMFVKQGVDAGKCAVVYNGIDPNVNPVTAVSEIRKQWGIGDGEMVIGTVGSLIKRKRINDLLEAVGELNNKFKIQNSKFKIIVVGDGPERKSLQEDVLKKGLQDKVIFTGFQTDAISYINAMDIFVLSSEQEGLPRVILEAMLMAKPVIACDVTGPSELVVDGETGFLVPAKNPQALTEALLKLIASSELRNVMGEKGRARAREKFSMDAYISGVSKVFEEVLS